MHTLAHPSFRLLCAPPIQQERHTHYFFGDDDTPALTKILARPYRHFVEMREYIQMGQTLRFIREEHPHASLSLTTRTAFEQPVAEHFLNMLSTKRTLHGMLLSDMRTCLQEAIMNAIIHGNLQLSYQRPDNFGFQAYLASVALALEDEENAMKRVNVFVWFTAGNITLCVSDQGRGFDIHQPPPALEHASGRGLALIRVLCPNVWQTKSNNLYMQFPSYA